MQHKIIYKHMKREINVSNLWHEHSFSTSLWTHSRQSQPKVLMLFTVTIARNAQSLQYIYPVGEKCGIFLGALSQNCEKRLLASSCLSVRPSAWKSSRLPLDGFSLKLIFWYIFFF